MPIPLAPHALLRTQLNRLCVSWVQRHLESDSTAGLRVNICASWERIILMIFIMLFRTPNCDHAKKTVSQWSSEPSCKLSCRSTPISHWEEGCALQIMIVLQRMVEYVHWKSGQPSLIVAKPMQQHSPPTLRSVSQDFTQCTLRT